jgi:hypothetical protein
MEHPPNLIAAARLADLPVSLYSFVLAYVAGGCNNGAEAWRQSHPDIKSDGAAGASASRALTNVNVEAAISAQLGRELIRSGVTSDNILIGIGQIAADPRARHSDRLKAYEMLGRYLSMWADRPELQQVVINMDLGGPTPQQVTIDAPVEPHPGPISPA